MLAEFDFWELFTKTTSVERVKRFNVVFLLYILWDLLSFVLGFVVACILFVTVNGNFCSGSTTYYSSDDYWVQNDSWSIAVGSVLLITEMTPATILLFIALIRALYKIEFSSFLSHLKQFRYDKCFFGTHLVFRILALIPTLGLLITQNVSPVLGVCCIDDDCYQVELTYYGVLVLLHVIATILWLVFRFLVKWLYNNIQNKIKKVEAIKKEEKKEKKVERKEEKKEEKKEERKVERNKEKKEEKKVERKDEFKVDMDVDEDSDGDDDSDGEDDKDSVNTNSS